MATNLHMNSHNNNQAAKAFRILLLSQGLRIQTWCASVSIYPIRVHCTVYTYNVCIERTRKIIYNAFVWECTVYIVQYQRLRCVWESDFAALTSNSFSACVVNIFVHLPPYPYTYGYKTIERCENAYRRTCTYFIDILSFCWIQFDMHAIHMQLYAYIHIDDDNDNNDDNDCNPTMIQTPRSPNEFRMSAHLHTALTHLYSGDAFVTIAWICSLVSLMPRARWWHIRVNKKQPHFICMYAHFSNAFRNYENATRTHPIENRCETFRTQFSPMDLYELLQ